MNVIVYAGPEVVQSSLLRITGALKSLLFPNYTVQTLTSQVIGSQPWSLNCALLVLPECDRFVPTPESARVRIQSYVEKGGIALALRAAMRQSQQPPHDGTLYFKHRALGYISMDAKTSIIPSNLTPGRKEEDGTAPIALRHDSTIGNVDAGSADEVLALAIHEGDDKVRGAVFSADLGKIAIWFPTGESHSHGSDPVDASLLADQMSFLRHTMVKLGIQVPTPAQDPQFGARPTVQYLVSRHSLSAIDQVAEALSLRFKADDIVVFEDTNDVFNYRLYSPAALEDARQQVIYPHDDPSTWQPKHVLVCSDGVLPSKSETPMFDLHAFYDALYPQSTLASGAQTWRIGDVLYFGNVVTSTQTMLDKNPKLLSSLPTPVVSLATHQLTGRGRGANTWLSPAGCLQFSVLLRLPLSTFPASKLVFVQYLFGLAVAEACRSKAVLGTVGDRVRLKWPNDIYVLSATSSKPEDAKKIGGILVNTSFFDGKVDIVIGCGINVLNQPPIMSLAQLLGHTDEHATPTMERTAAVILSTFQAMWTTFVAEKGSFDGFMDQYLERWLHSDQAVMLTTVTPPLPVRIVGITSDHGLLRTLPEQGGWSRAGANYVDLQPDGNSFDLMSGLIKTKA